MKTLALLAFTTLSFLLQAQWKSLKGPYGGEVFDYKNEGISTYVRTSNGFYRSDDDGKNWKRLDDGLSEFQGVFSFCVDKNEIFLSYFDLKTLETAMVYSNDQGDHWTKLQLPEPNWACYEMAYSNGILIAQGPRELIESHDKGLTWKPCNIGTRVGFAYFVRSNHSFFFVSSSSEGIYRRAVNDTTWHLINQSTEYYSDFHITDSIFIILKENATGLRSTDNGLTWKNILIKGIADNTTFADFGDSLYFTNKEYIYKSKDKGLNWNIIKAAEIHDFYFTDLIRAGNSLLGNAVTWVY